MSNLANIDYETIENKIMMVLVQNQGKLLSKSTLYGKVLDKFDDIKDIKFVDPQFKYNFLITVKSLPAKYDDIEIINFNTRSYIVFNNLNQEEDLIDRVLQEPINSYNLPNQYETAIFIVDNNLYDKLYCDTNTTIYHDLIAGSYHLQVNKLISDKKMKINVKDDSGKLPIEYIDNFKMSNLFIKDLYNKLESLNNKLESLENKLEFFENKVESLENKNKSLESAIMGLNKNLELSLFNLILKKIFNIMYAKPKQSFIVSLILIFIIYKKIYN